MMDLFLGKKNKTTSSTKNNDDNDDSEDDEEEEKEDPYSPSAYVKAFYVAEDGSLMPEVAVQDVWDNDSRYRKYLSDVDTLAYLLNAEVVNQYPYIDSASNSELNGTIRFYRNNTSTRMKYISTEKLRGYMFDFNTYGNEEAKNEALRHFSINSDGSLEIACVYQELVQNGDETYYRDVLRSNSISYRNLVQKYTVQFELLWAIVTAGFDGNGTGGNSQDFACAIASMAYDGDIEFIISDNYTTTTTTETEFNTLQEKVRYSDITLNLADNPYMPEFETNVRDVRTTTKTTEYTQTTTTPTIIVKKIESWCAKLDSDIEIKKETDNKETEDESEAESNTEWESQGVRSDTTLYSECNVEPIKTYFQDRSDISEKTAVLSNREVFHRTKTVKKKKIKTVSSEYSAVTEAPRLNEDLIDLFNVISYNAVKQHLINDFYSSFIEIIEANATTANMTDLINYIFNQLTKSTDYGEDIDFETAWEKAYASYTSLVGGSSGIEGNVGTVFDYLLNKGISPVGCAAIIGNFYGESGVNPGNLEDSSNSKSGLSDEEFTERVNNRSISRSEFISSSTFGLYNQDGYITYGYGLAQWTWYTRKANLYDATVGKGYKIDDLNAQLDFLWQELTTSYSSICDNMRNASDVDTATHDFMKSFEGIVNSSLSKRQEFARQTYEKYKNNQLTTKDKDDNENNEEKKEDKDNSTKNNTK